MVKYYKVNWGDGAVITVITLTIILGKDKVKNEHGGKSHVHFGSRKSEK